MRRIIYVLLCFFILAGGVPTKSFALEQFNSEQAAQKHCPQDTVVWLNLPTGVFHYKHQRWYANTKKGAFVCEKEAVSEGKRRSKRG